MKSIVEDFEHIAARLSEIAQEKHPTIMASNAEDDKTAANCEPRFPNAINWSFVSTQSIEDDIYCGFLI